MGGSQSSRRRRQQSPSMYPLPLAPPPPPGYTEVGPCPHFAPYYYHQPHVYQQGYYVPNHHFVPNPASPPLPLPPPPQSLRTASSAPVTVPEYQKASTVRNDVNLNKGTLRLEKDKAVPEHHVVAFSFDATSAGSISVFFLARESADGSIASLSKMFPQPRRFYFRSGLGQKFKQDSGLDFSLIDEEDLSKVSGDNTIFPLIIRIETVPKQQQQLSDEQEPPVGGALTKWIHCQQTYAVIEKKDDSDFQVKVMKQIIWVDGVRYELQEIYGIATSEQSSGSSSNDSSKECVICLSEPKDTTVLPCRHMCMCSDCANVLRYQTNLCPICRCPVEELLQIKVPAQQIEAA